MERRDSIVRFAVPIYLTNKKESDSPVVIDMDYNGKLLSLMKLGLSHVNKDAFDKLYLQNKQKLFATSTYFLQARFAHNSIYLNRKGKLVLYFTAYDKTLGLNFYNAFAWLRIQSDKAKRHLTRPLTFGSDYNAEVGKIYLINETPVLKSKQLFKANSPIVIQNENKRFVSCTDDSNLDEYNKAIRFSTLKKVDKYPELKDYVSDLVFKPVKTRKTVRKMFGNNIESTVGMFELTGNPKLLTYLEQVGLGINTGTFNGMITAI